MGERSRLRADLDASTFPSDVQVILKALKKYGMISAGNGSSWILSGAADTRWNIDNLDTRRRHKAVVSSPPCAVPSRHASACGPDPAWTAH
jgi:hypothetical protein